MYKIMQLKYFFLLFVFYVLFSFVHERSQPNFPIGQQISFGRTDQNLDFFRVKLYTWKTVFVFGNFTKQLNEVPGVELVSKHKGFCDT